MSELGRAYTLFKRLFIYKPTITNVWFEVTDHCNSRCTNCNKWKGPFTEDLLTPLEILDMFKHPIFKDVKNIINSGGEPSTRDDLAAVLISEHTALPDAVLELSTNGLRPGKIMRVVDAMLKWYPELKMRVGVSLESMNEDEHDEIRGVKGSYKHTMSLLNELKKIRDRYGRDRLEIGIGTVINDRTVDNINEIRYWATQSGYNFLAQWYNTSSFYANEGGDQGSSEVCSRRDEIKEIVRDLDYTILSDLWCDHLSGKPINFHCMATRGFVAIKCNGDIVPCLNKWDLPVASGRDPITLELLDLLNEFDITVRCEDQCLNSWGTYWSFESDPRQYLKYFIRHPIKLIRKLCS